MLDIKHLDPNEAYRAAPNLANLQAALKELRDTGRIFYEQVDGSFSVLDAEAGLAIDELERAMSKMPHLRRFLGVMLIARESRLARDRGGRPRRVTKKRK